ncbi:MAG: branched-chain amino acid ABC transporter permease [bacterium]
MSVVNARRLGPSLAGRMMGRNAIATMTILVLAVGLLIVMPFFLTDFLQLQMTRFLAFAIFGMAYNLVYGYTGMLSLGHGAFFGMGAYTVGLLTLHTSVTSFWVALPIAVVVAAGGAAIFSFFFLRVKGSYFLLITFGFSQLMYALTWSIKWFNKPGMQGISDIKFPTIGVSGFTWTHQSFYFLTLAFFVICYFLINAIINSPFGHALVGMRENEDRMKALGYNVWAFRYAVLVICGAFCGLAGLLFAYNGSFVYPNHLGFDYSWIPMLVVILGGAGTKLGPIVGAGIVVWFEYFISLLTPQRWPLILGALFIAVIMYFRGGVVAYVTRVFEKAGDKHEPAAD